MNATIFHNANCSTSRNVLALLRARGLEPAIVDYLKAPLTADELRTLAARMNVPVRAIVRTKEKLYADLNLADAGDDALLAAMAEHPVLLNRPIVITARGAKLCRPSETVAELF